MKSWERDRVAGGLLSSFVTMRKALHVSSVQFVGTNRYLSGQVFTIIHVKVTAEPLTSAPQQKVPPISFCLDSKVPFSLPDLIHYPGINHHECCCSEYRSAYILCHTGLFSFGHNTGLV